MIKDGESNDKIVRYTALPAEVVEKLRDKACNLGCVFGIN